MESEDIRRAGHSKLVIGRFIAGSFSLLGNRSFLPSVCGYFTIVPFGLKDVVRC